MKTLTLKEAKLLIANGHSMVAHPRKGRVMCSGFYYNAPDSVIRFIQSLKPAL